MKKFIGFSSVLVLSLSFISGCSATKNASDTSSNKAIEVTVSLIKGSEVIEEKEFSTTEEATLMEAMKEQFDLNEEKGMITSIDGITQDEAQGYYWVYRINNEMINTGANETNLKQGDQIEFTYEKF